MSSGGEVSISRRLLAFFIDHALGLMIAIGGIALAGLATGALESGNSTAIEDIIQGGLYVYFIVQFAYQYWSLLTGKPTWGQAVAKFHVDASARNFQPGYVQHLLGMIGINLVDGRSKFWPATFHIVLASLSAPVWPIVLILALLDSENRFWWARIAGTSTVDMRIAFRNKRAGH